MMEGCEHTRFETAGGDLDMTWVRLTGNLVPWSSLALVRHSQLVDTGWVGWPEWAAQIAGFVAGVQQVGCAVWSVPE